MTRPVDMLRRLFVAAAVLACVGPLSTSAQTQPALRQSFDLQIPVPPTPFKVEGKTQLVYELNLTNFTGDELALKRVEVLNADPGRPPLADFRDAELASLIARPGSKPDLADKRSIAPGLRAVVYIWLSLDGAVATPGALKHRIEFDVVRSTGREHAVVEGDAVSVSEVAPVVLHSPLRGGPWAAIYDGSWERGHRRVMFAVNGRARIPARLAIDWVKLDQDGKSVHGDSAKVSNWLGYAADVLAVADSTVASLRDGVAESASLADGGTARTLEEGSGNFVALNLGQGRYAFYEHLKPGSIKVKVGERVRSGQVIAALGFTGDSTGPHLHFHVSDANATLAAEGLPFVFRGFDLLGRFETIDAFAQGKPWLPLPAGVSKARRGEMPAPIAVVDFGAD